MRTQRLRVLQLAMISCCITGLSQRIVLATVILENGAINNINSATEDIELRNGPGNTSTIVNIMPGAELSADEDTENSVLLTQDSLMLFSGGNAAGSVAVADNSVAILLGTANIEEDLIAENNTEVQLSNQAVVEGDVEIGDSSTMNMTGGEIEGTLEVSMGTLHLSGGIVGESVEGSGLAVLNISGGTIGEGVLALASTANISGGNISEGVAAAANGSATISGATLEPFDGDEIRASLASDVTVDSVIAEQLNVLSQNSSTVALNDFGSVEASATATTASSVTIAGGTADTLTLMAEEGGSIDLIAGAFGFVGAGILGSESLGDSTLTVFGAGFAYNGVPLEDLNDVLGPGAYDETTGELLTIAGTLTGVLSDGSPLTMEFQRDFIPAGLGHLILVTVPEPTALGLAVCSLLGVVVMRGRAHA